MGCDIRMLYEFLVGFRETETNPRTRGSCHMSIFGSGCDNFIGIRVVDFLNFHSIFTSPMDINCIFVVVYRLCKFALSSNSRRNEYSTTKKMQPTTKGTCRRGGCLDITRIYSTGRALSPTRILSSTNATFRNYFSTSSSTF